ncbi:hypothetical protein [Streptomyces sp. NPDC047014]|uniref:hypothetical protein n=1 Tax=Streptomyces sp. NPDC047014 TaxID=3155736 RepID=UPI0033FF6D86
MRGTTHGMRPGTRDLADGLRGPAELAEWERIVQLLAEAPAGSVYAPDVDDVVQAELAADAAAAAQGAEPREPPGSRPAPTSSRCCAASAPGTGRAGRRRRAPRCQEVK